MIESYFCWSRSCGGWTEKWYRWLVQPLSWFDSPSCGVKGFALILGCTQRDFLKLALSFGFEQCEQKVICMNTSGVSPSRYRTDADWAAITEAGSWAHIVTDLFKFVFASLFPPLQVTYLFCSYGNCSWFTSQLWNILNRKISISVFEYATYEIHKLFVVMRSCCRNTEFYCSS